jgi:hypothetical protein
MCRTQTAQSDSTRTARGAPNQFDRTAPLDLKITDVSVAISPVTPMSQHIPFIPTHFWIWNSRRRDPTTVAARSHLPVRRLRPCQARREGCPQLAFILVLHLPMNHRSSAPRHSLSTIAAFFASSSIRRFTKVHRLRWVYIEFTLHEEFHRFPYSICFERDREHQLDLFWTARFHPRCPRLHLFPDSICISAKFVYCDDQARPTW